MEFENTDPGGYGCPSHYIDPQESHKKNDDSGTTTTYIRLKRTKPPICGFEKPEEQYGCASDTTDSTDTEDSKE
jgi:hypothetical protein